MKSQVVAGGRRRAPPRAQRLAGATHAVVALPVGGVRLGRAAHRLRTDDIFATVATPEANGVALLPIPENYYDDLEAKTDLPPERSRRSRRTTSSTTATARASISRSTRRPSRSASSSRSSSGAAIAASAPPMRRSGSRRRHSLPDLPPCHGADTALRTLVPPHVATFRSARRDGQDSRRLKTGTCHRPVPRLVTAAYSQADVFLSPFESSFFACRGPRNLARSARTARRASDSQRIMARWTAECVTQYLP